MSDARARFGGRVHGGHREAVNIPVTVKCRMGVWDDQDPETALPQLVTSCREAGVEVFIIHARKAWLEGLSQRKPRNSPLDYPLVYRLKQQFPDISIIINGALKRLIRHKHICAGRRRDGRARGL
ncbi:MAG: hypothetical protein CM15mP21_1490 [Hyphomicrobiales bacterium]|nr:MAG: hypothetical protein CM15mP21_1490 [Hyphomicrobiales bacterium]